MAKKKQNKLSRWIIIPLAAVVLLAIFGLWKNNTPKSQQPETGQRIYQSPAYGFSIEYPNDWENVPNTQVFENGDAVSFRKTGPTQKEQTELTDGAQVTIAQPSTIYTDLSTWIKQYYTGDAQFSQEEVQAVTFQKIYDCSRAGCMTYYYTMRDGKVFGIATFAQGASKTEYESAISSILYSLQFGGSANGTVTKEDAIVKVKAISEVTDYLKRVPQGRVEVSSEEDKSYLIQVFEVINGHTATFNWYNVDKTTGEIEKQF